LQTIYPEYLSIWKLHKRPGYWSDIVNQRIFFDELAVKFNIQKPDDWYRVTTNMVLNEGGSFIKLYYNGSILQGIL
jgi:hypothetical protein